MPEFSGLFSGGIALPFGPDNRGGVALIEGDEYISQLIRVLASNGDSENPFLDVGIGLRAIFQNLDDPAYQAQLRREIEAVFDDLRRAQIAKLLSVSFAPSDDPNNPAEFIATVRYLSIETATEQQVDTPIRRS
jgi:hypothetical protein